MAGNPPYRTIDLGLEDLRSAVTVGNISTVGFNVDQPA